MCLISFFQGNISSERGESKDHPNIKIFLIRCKYSPDLAPTDYHLFRSLSNYLKEKKFDDENDLEMDLLNFFGQKSQDFYEPGILSLPERWRQVIDGNGAYIVES